MRKPNLMNIEGILPLRARKLEDDSLYERRPMIEQLLHQLLEVEVEEIARRAQVLDQQDPNYLPPEVLVHYLRRSKDDENTGSYERIFMSLRQHLLQRLKVQRRTLSGDRVIEDRFQADVRDRVMDRVMEILCEDQKGYDTRLDYYEVNFNGAVSRARITAKRDLVEKKKTENTQSLDARLSSDEAGEVDATIRSLRGVSEDFSDLIYRSEVISAINTLPNEEQEVMLMLIEGYKIKEIAEKVGCTAKTASARRNRARAKLRREMNVEVKS